MKCLSSNGTGHRWESENEPLSGKAQTSCPFLSVTNKADPDNRVPRPQCRRSEAGIHRGARSSREDANACRRTGQVTRSRHTAPRCAPRRRGRRWEPLAESEVQASQRPAPGDRLVISLVSCDLVTDDGGTAGSARAQGESTRRCG